jgi:hypothetical protein
LPTTEWTPRGGREEFIVAKQLGPLEISCDAPPFSVVTACRRVGFQEPEDVRWSRLSQVLGAPSREWEALKRNPLKLVLRMGAPDMKKCHCGQKLPELDHYTFTFLAGEESSYLLGQCPRCRTVYWEET